MFPQIPLPTSPFKKFIEFVQLFQSFLIVACRVWLWHVGFSSTVGIEPGTLA